MAKYEAEAAVVARAIRAFNNNEDALFNFECYLSYHFKEWLETVADTPECMAYELRCFANMDF